MIEEQYSTISDLLQGTIIAECGDLPYPFGSTSFPAQAGWSRILFRHTAALVAKTVRGLQGTPADHASEQYLARHIREVVQEAIRILRRPAADTFGNGGQESQTGLAT